MLLDGSGVVALNHRESKLRPGRDNMKDSIGEKYSFYFFENYLHYSHSGNRVALNVNVCLHFSNCLFAGGMELNCLRLVKTLILMDWPSNGS